MSLVTRDDFTETLSKIKQRGFAFVLSKLSLSKHNRTKSSFNKIDFEAANWWCIPEVKNRLAEKATGDQNLPYEDYVVENHLKGKEGLRLLSLGCGIGSHELRFARYQTVFSEVLGVDISDKLLSQANKVAEQEGLTNLTYKVGDVNRHNIAPNTYDVVLFHASLHHFSPIDKLLGETVYSALKPDGLLVINEYVGPSRLLLTKAQVNEVNAILKNTVPEKYKVRLGTKRKKQRVSGPGRLRMILSDPSEAVDSASIMPAIARYYQPVEEKLLGGNILSPLLKDIAHHFQSNDVEAMALLEKLFALEDKFLESNPSDLVFGVYRKRPKSSREG